MNLNKCNYSEGGGHDYCSHSHYCIFNEKRWRLEKKLTKLLKEYNELKTQKNSYILGYYCNVDYNEIIKKLNLVQESISRLIEFKQKILDNEVKGYGYEVLESTRIRTSTRTNKNH